MTSRMRIGGVGWAVTAVAVLVASTPTPALAQRGISNQPDDAAVAATDDQAAQSPMQGMQRGQGMARSTEAMTERERLEQMREHMVAGMRRMAVRMAAIQDRLAALERGDESAPPVEGRGMGMQQGHGGMQQGKAAGQGMQRRDGTGPGCQAPPAAPAPPPADGERGDDR